MFGLSREKSVVGLDIGSYSVKAVELRARKKGGHEAYEVVKIGYEPLPHDAIVEGTIIDSAAVVETIRLVFDENKISTKDVGHLHLRQLRHHQEDLAPGHGEARARRDPSSGRPSTTSPTPTRRPTSTTPSSSPRAATDEKNLDILLVAAKKDKIANYSNVVNQARKNLQSIEVDVFALQNVLEVNYPEIFSDKTLALINIGANITNVVIVERGTPQLFRDLSLGGFFFTENMRKELNIPFEEAEKLLKGIPGKIGRPRTSSRRVLSMNVRDLLDEIEKTFSFYEASEKRERKIEQICPQRRPGQRPEHGRRLRDTSSGSRPRSSIPSAISRSTTRSSIPIYFNDMAPIFGVAVGLGDPKGGEVTMIRINLLKPETKDIRETVAAPGAAAEVKRPRKARTSEASSSSLLVIALGAFYFFQKKAFDRENALLTVGPAGKEQAPVRQAKLEEQRKAQGLPGTEDQPHQEPQRPAGPGRPDHGRDEPASAGLGLADRDHL